MSEELNVLFSSMNEPRIMVGVTKNTRGFNWEAKVSYAKTVEEAMALLEEATSKLEERYGEDA